MLRQVQLFTLLFLSFTKVSLCVLGNTCDSSLANSSFINYKQVFQQQKILQVTKREKKEKKKRKKIILQATKVLHSKKMPRKKVPKGRLGHVAVHVDHNIMVFGGARIRDGDWRVYVPVSMRIIWMYNMYTENWRKYMTSSNQNAPPALIDTCAAKVGTDVFMFGGNRVIPDFEVPDIINDLWRLKKSPGGCFVWSQIKPNINCKVPSPRTDHSGWEYGGKLGIFGGEADNSVAYLNDNGKFDKGITNQLLCFDPTSNIWENPKCFGSVPEPCVRHSMTVLGHKVWLYGGLNYGNDGAFLEDLYELDLHSFTWTQIEIWQPMPCSGHSFTAIGDSQLVLHSNIFKETWILDLLSLTWTKYRVRTLYPVGVRSPWENQTGSSGMNKSVIVFGGCDERSTVLTLKVMLEPKSLQQLAMKTVHKHHTKLPLRYLPMRMITLLGLSETNDDLESD